MERMDRMKNVKLSQKLTESGLLLALAVILSVLKIIDLPYGGSITLASMLPLIILSYRYGFTWGLLSGFHRHRRGCRCDNTGLCPCVHGYCTRRVVP